MSVTNNFVPFSPSTNGLPIIVDVTANPTTIPTTDPGTLIHASTAELDSLWVWASVDDAVSYLDTVYIRVLKGNNSLGFTEDSLVKLTSGAKVILETGVIITGNIEYRVYIDNELSTVLPNVSITGYVHRRVY